jgi:RecA-family ATPase
MKNLPEYERCVLGAIVLDNASMKDIRVLLTPEDFSNEFYRKTFGTMLRLHESNRPIDPQLVFDEFDERDRTTSNLAKLADLSSNVPPHIGHYCRVVRDAAQTRRIQALLSKASTAEGSAADIAGRLISELTEFQQQPQFGTTGEMFVNSDRFCSTIPDEIDWLVDRIIPRGTNGIIAGVPKVSKSVLATDLAVALATGEPFLGFDVPRPVKVAIVSREDHPGLTGWRLRAFRKSRGLDSIPNLIINTRQQSETFMLDDVGQVGQMIEQLKRHRVEFAILDVFNRMHSKDENDAQEMTGVMAKLTEIQTRAKCGLALIHHYNKTKEGSWTEKLRGSSAISGWVEWLVGVTMDDQESKTRKAEFELKAAEAPSAVWYQIESSKEEKTMRIRVTDDPSVLRSDDKRSSRERRLV